MTHLSPHLALLPLLLVTACSAGDTPVRLPDAIPVIDTATARALHSAPTTGGDAAPIEWGYRFAAGDRLRFRRLTTSTNKTGSPRYFRGEDEVLVEVERVAVDGSTTLTMTTVKNLMSEKEGPTHPLIKSSYVDRTPQIRVTIDRFGRMLDGEIVEDTEEHARAKEMAAQPGSGVRVAPDRRMVEHELRDFLPQLVGPATLRMGEIYRDTVIDSRTSRMIKIDTTDLDEPVPGKVKRSPFSENGTVEWTMTTINTMRPIGWVEHDGKRYLRVEGTFDRTEPLPIAATFVYWHQTEYLVDANGIIVSTRTRGGKTMDGIDEGTMEEVVELVRED